MAQTASERMYYFCSLILTRNVEFLIMSCKTSVKYTVITGKWRVDLSCAPGVLSASLIALYVELCAHCI